MIFLLEELNVGTVPMFKIHNVGTVPIFKMHNVVTQKNYDLCFELEFGLQGKNKRLLFASVILLESSKGPFSRPVLTLSGMEGPFKPPLSKNCDFSGTEPLLDLRPSLSLVVQ